MFPHHKRPGTIPVRSLALAAIALFVMAACQSGGSPSSSSAAKSSSIMSSDASNVANTYLFVSAPEFYFGTRDVGTVTTQPIELTNRGGDIYPVNTVTVTGENAEEFTTDLRDPITLNPSERVRINVSFAPLDEGRRYAALDIDFDTIKQVAEADNVKEQTYYRARELEDAGDYQGSLDAYDDYVDSRPVTLNEQRAAIKMPVIQEAARYGAEEDFGLYLDAMNAREAGETEVATAALDALLAQHPDSYLADDALYLQGYIELVDRDDQRAALERFGELRAGHPDTTYHDTALYAEALAHQELGDDERARSILTELRLRHTGFAMLGVALPKDDMVSRLWFMRATEGLERLEEPAIG